MEQMIKRWELVELIIPAATTGRVTFQTIPQLRNQTDQIIVIRDIEVFTVSSYANSQQNGSLPGMPVADVPLAVLVLYVNGEESIKNIPLSMLIHVDDFANVYHERIFSFDALQNVDFDKSYVQYSAASTNANYVIPFGISYMRLVKSPTGIQPTVTTPQGNFYQG